MAKTGGESIGSAGEEELPVFFYGVFGPDPRIAEGSLVSRSLIIIVDSMEPYLEMIELAGGQVLIEESFLDEETSVATCVSPDGTYFTVVKERGQSV